MGMPLVTIDRRFATDVFKEAAVYFDPKIARQAAEEWVPLASSVPAPGIENKKRGRHESAPGGVAARLPSVLRDDMSVIVFRKSPRRGEEKAAHQKFLSLEIVVLLIR